VIGSGCIAQVYQGQWFGEAQTTTGDQKQEVEEGKGVKVAVKVCHPNIRGKVQSDLAILKWACAQLEWWLPQTAYLGTLDVMADFEQLMRRQMDLRLEAHNLLRFRENFAEERSLDVSFPEPLWYESSEVLVEGFMEGLPIYKFIHGTQYTAEHKRKIADAGINISLTMVFKHNFIHADLHPGNILIAYDPITNPEDTPSIVCLDAGLAYEVQRHTRMVEILGALMMRDGRTAGRHMITPMTAADDHIHAEQAVAAYCEGMQDLVDSSAHIRFFEHLGDYIYKFFTLAFEHKVKLDHNFVCVAMAIKVMEGLALRLHPSLDLINVAIPYVAACKVNETNRALQERARRIIGLPNRTTEAHSDASQKSYDQPYQDWLAKEKKK